MNSKGVMKRKFSSSAKEEVKSRINNEDELSTTITNEDGGSSDAENDAESDSSDAFGTADSGALSLGNDEDDDTDSEFSEYGTDADEEEGEDDDDNDDDDDDEEEEEEEDDEDEEEKEDSNAVVESESDELIDEDDDDDDDDDDDSDDDKTDHHKKQSGKTKRTKVKGKNSSEGLENKADSEDDGIENDYGNDESSGENKVEEKASNTYEKQEKHLQSKAKQTKKVQGKAQKASSITSPLLKRSSKKSRPTTEIASDGVKLAEDEYAYDTSDEEDVRNTVGNIPMNWYDDYQHLGYDWEGKKILKPVKEDELDSFLRRMEDPNFWRTVRDPQTGQDVVLSEEDVDIIQRLQAQKIPDPNFDDEAPWVEWFTSEVMQTPIVRVPDHKRSFLPSRIEARKIAKMVHSLKMGWMKTTEEREKEKEKKKEPNFYMLWQTDEGVEHMRRIHNHIPAPKRHLPGHAESYNPPSEYLFDKKELKQWNRLKDAPWKRKLHFIPQKYPSLRQVPSYDRYIKERFQRCLDLYLCPRARKMRLTIEPEDLLPQLPNPKDLQPFPTVMSMVYEGHTDMVRCVTVEPKGQYIASGSDDLTVKVWEIATGRCVRTIPVGGIVRSLSWCPNQALSLLAVAADRKVLLANPDVGDHLVRSKTDSLLKEPPEQDFAVPERVKAAVQWEVPEEEHWNKGVRIIINHFKEVKQVTWHGRGDYFATVMPDGQNRSVIIHQLSKRRSQVPFSKSKGLIQCVLFHPIRPFFFVASQRNIRVYDLAKQELVKKLQSNSKWISSMAVHPGGDNLLVGTYDRKMLWFDLDLSTKPYQTLRLHNTAVRGVAYHKQYPLFASGSDDCSVIVCHGMVYNDLLQNPLIVPLKRLSYHEYFDDFGVFDVIFHPTQPWVFSSGADKKIRLYT